MAKVYVVKLGGSVLSQGGDVLFDFSYLKKLHEMLHRYLDRGDKFFIALGGGYLMRQYRDLALKATGFSQEQLHEIGINVIYLHANLARLVLDDIADAEIFSGEDYYQQKKMEIKKGVKIGGGGRPGYSGDMDALMAAMALKSTEVISLKNIDGVYDSDPKQNSEAKRVMSLSWQEYLQIIGNPEEQLPGANYPVDPETARKAQQEKISFKIMLGTDLENFAQALEGLSFSGTIIK